MNTRATVKQCATCPWRTSCVPERDIPGYDRELAKRLTCTLASGIESAAPAIAGGTMRVMACHYTKVGAEHACAGWLANQLGPGNNLGLRLLVTTGRMPAPEIDGPQHERYEDTLPKAKPRKRRKARR